MRSSANQLWRSWVERRDERAFADLVRPELPHVVGAVVRSGVGTAEAEDALQDALVMLARERSARPVEIGIRPWLVRSARLRAKTAARSRRRRRGREKAVARPEEPGTGRRFPVRSPISRPARTRSSSSASNSLPSAAGGRRPVSGLPTPGSRSSAG